MYSKEFLQDYLNINMQSIAKECLDVLSYVQDKGIAINKDLYKILKLNYYTTDNDYFVFTTKSGTRSWMEVMEGGVFAPITINTKKEIKDFVIIIHEACKDEPIYLIHELLHFVSTGYEMNNEKIPCGIAYFMELTEENHANLSINEGITDYFAYNICSELYGEKYKTFLNNGETHLYYYSALLIEMLVSESDEKRNKLLKAYITNNREYIFKEFKRCFGLNKTEVRKLFVDGEEAIVVEDAELKKEYIKRIEKIIKYYYYNVYVNTIKKGDTHFIENTLKKFEI